MSETSRSNGYGDYRTTVQADQAAFDACPTTIRHALNYAVSPYASERTLKAVRKGVPHSVIIHTFRRIDAEETLKAYGPSHPEAGRAR